MKIGKMFRWYWQNTYWALVGFYGAMFLLMLLGCTIMISSGAEHVNLGGFSFSAQIWLLVMGIIFFSAGTRFGLSNGASRKTIFCAIVLFLLVLSSGMAVLALLFQWSGERMGLNTSSLENLMYPLAGGMAGTFRIAVSQIAGGWALGMLGYFIGGAYYRMNKIWKIIVSIAVPVLLIFGLPLFLTALPADAAATLAKWFCAMIEWVAQSPYHLSLLWLGGAVLCGLFSWLLIRRAPVKTAG
ncbi:MAG: hypothetical protein ACI4I8_01105 [Oscillospiraceae bacterium]